MFKLITTATIMLLAGILVAQEVTGPVLTPYGLVQYRLRGQIFQLTPDTGKAATTMDYMNQIGYFAGLKVKVNESVFMQFQAGNDWVSTEAVGLATNNWGAVGHLRSTSPATDTTASANPNYPYFHLAYAKWDAKILYVQIGLQPVVNNGPLDLMERSMVGNNYKAAGLITWIVGTNASQAGLKVGAPILKDKFKLNADLFTGVVTPRSQSLVVDAKNNPSSVMLVLDLPMTVAALTITPQVAAVVNRNYNSSIQAGDHEIGFGFAGSYKIKDGLTANACFGMAMLSNKNSGDTAHPAIYDNQGIIAGVGGTMKAGPGNAIVDFKYSSDENKEHATDSSKTSYIYVDVKYGWDANKNFSIMPRVRLFLTQYEESNALTSKMETRPELIFTGKF